MTTKAILKTKIETLIQFKNEYDIALKNVEILRNKKNKTEEEVKYILQSLNMEDKTIIVNNQRIIQKTFSVSQGLTLKFIEETLEKYNNYDSRLKDTFEPKEFIKFIKKNRPKYTKTEIKID
tara:strand:+ start:420 stop:785 length:366 start_codon:yes stop_codon:yes gene_type:complete